MSEYFGAANGFWRSEIEVSHTMTIHRRADAVPAFQRAETQNKVATVIGSYISEVTLAIERGRRVRMCLYHVGSHADHV